MSTPWIDFKQLRDQLSFTQILDHYQVENVTRKGDQLSCFCPLPGHDGQKNSKSFSAHDAKGIFNCFGCGAKGNLLDFSVLMEEGDPKDGTSLRAVAIKIAKAFNISMDRPGQEESNTPEPKRKGERKKKSKTPPPEKRAEEPEDTEDTSSPVRLPVEINVPLSFSLRSLDQGHEFFEREGISQKAVSHFELGYCEKGLMKGRIAIPVHDADGNLVAYAGRLENPDVIEEENPPKYYFPPPREKDGIRYEFHKSELLYNGWRLDDDLDELIVVEGFRDVWHLWQCGIENVVAIMGTDCSERQAELILQHISRGGRVTFCFDADKAGKRCTKETFLLIGQHRWACWIKLSKGSDPAQISTDKLKEMLSK